MAPFGFKVCEGLLFWCPCYVVYVAAMLGVTKISCWALSEVEQMYV